MIRYIKGAQGRVRLPAYGPGMPGWNRPTYDRILKRLNKADVPMNPGFLLKNLPVILTRAKAIYGSYKKALAANGINHAKVLLIRHFLSKIEVKRGIGTLDGKGISLISTSVESVDDHLLHSGMFQYDTWRKAVEATGRNYDKIKEEARQAARMKKIESGQIHLQVNAKDELKAAIKARGKAGKPITQWFVKKEDPDLFKSGRRIHNKSWRAAVEDAGFNYKKQLLSDWSEEQILAEIRLMDNANKSVELADVIKENPDLVEVAIMRLKLWRIAVERGVNPFKPRLIKPDPYYSDGRMKPLAVFYSEIEKLNRTASVPESGIDTVLLNRVKASREEVQSFIVGFSKSNDLFRVTIEGSTIHFGTIHRMVDGKTMGHAQIVDGAGTFFGHLTLDGTIEISPVDYRIMKGPIPSHEHHNSYVRFARFLIENGFPGHYLLSNGTIDILQKPVLMLPLPLDRYKRVALIHLARLELIDQP